MKRKVTAGVFALVASTALLVGCGSDTPDKVMGDSHSMSHSAEKKAEKAEKEKKSEADKNDKTADQNNRHEEEAPKPKPRVDGPKNINGKPVPLTVAEYGVKGPDGLRTIDPRTPGLIGPDDILNPSIQKLNENQVSSSTPSASICSVAGDPGRRLVVPVAYLANCNNIEENVSSMQWVVWADTVAYGTGIIQANNCIPSCAAGKTVDTPVTVTLMNPVNGRFATAIVDKGIAGYDVYNM